VKRYSARLRLPVIFGDTNFFKASVTGKRKENGAGLVDVALTAENQLGEKTASGTATVELPCR
jgi:acyl dehydratase